MYYFVSFNTFFKVLEIWKVLKDYIEVYFMILNLEVSKQEENELYRWDIQTKLSPSKCNHWILDILVLEWNYESLSVCISTVIIKEISYIITKQ